MNRIPEESLRFLVIIKNDSKRLFERIKYREREYLQILSLKRTRDHLTTVFKSYYDSVTIADLKLCSSEVIISLDNFYAKIEELKWYLMHTEDMPAMLEDKMSAFQKDIAHLYDNLMLYINAEIGIEEVEDSSAEPDPFDDLPDLSNELDFQIEDEGDTTAS